MLYNQNPRIALIIIGNEILSGRTLDKNTQYVASKLSSYGIELKEVRVIPDDESEIIATVNLLRKKFDYVFTTGGIGPTHDDITCESVAKAFGVEIHQHPEAYDILCKYYEGEQNLNPGRIKMSVVPKGAKLIYNPVSAAPGFNIENVFVMAGVPKIMQAMLDNVIPKLRHGKEVVSKTVQVHAAESKIAQILTEVQNKYKHVDMGSYPYMVSDGFDAPGTNIVFRCVDENEIAKAIGEFKPLLIEAGIKFEEK